MSSIVGNSSFHKKLFYSYILISLISIIYAGATYQYFIAAIPLGLLGIFLAITDYSKLYYLLFFVLPFSIDISIAETNIGLPAEAIIGLLALVSIFLFVAGKMDKGFLTSPLSIIIIIHMLTVYASLPFSTMPMVSLKFAIVKTAYILVFYLLIAKVLKEKPEKIVYMFLIYGIAFIPVILIILNNHASFGFDKNKSNSITQPFYNDHTIYGACLCLIWPVIAGLWLFKKRYKIGFLLFVFIMFSTVIFSAAIFFSFSRAAWMSLVLAFGLIPIMLLRIKPNLLIGICLSSITVFLIFKEPLLHALKENKHDSNARNADVGDQLKSVTSVKKDVSNAERVNRWNSALKMFYERPLTGFGPGTYQFQYIPFQYSEDMTRISITSGKHHTTPGEGGSAHSEFLLLLSESGLLAGATFVLLIIFVIHRGLNVYYRSEDKRHKIIVASLLIGLMSYFIHAFFNNFLDQEEASSLFWSAIAAIAVLDTEYLKTINKKSN